MKIDIVLTACNMNEYYYNLFPYVYRVWKERFGLELYMCLISNYIPEKLKPYESNIILFEPIDGLNECYQAQVIRILYPCLFENKNVLITDMDIIPISKEYFINSTNNYTEDKFITFTDRYVKSNMYAICYNLANSHVWSEIFGVKNIQDVRRILIENYTDGYNGKKNCAGWYTDQQLLYSYVSKYEKVIVLNDKEIGYKRLDGKGSARASEIGKNRDDILNNIHTFSDFHIIRNYHVQIKLLELFIEKIINC